MSLRNLGNRLLRSRSGKTGDRSACGVGGNASRHRRLDARSGTSSDACRIVGLGAALVLTQVLRSFLFGVGAADPGTYAAVLVVFLGAAFLASMVPALRAARIDAMAALGEE